MSHDIKRYSQTLNTGEVHLYLKIPIGASGATGTIVGKGVSAVAKTATGLYDVTLDRGYARLLYLDGTCIATTGALNHVVLDADYTAGSTTLSFATRVQAGTDTEPASGDVILLHLVFDELGI